MLKCNRRLEDVFQRELDHARVHAGGRNRSERARPHIGKGISRSRAVVRIGELRVVERVEEFSTELDRLILNNLDPFQNREIPVELAGAENDTDSRITVVRTVAYNG